MPHDSPTSDPSGDGTNAAAEAPILGKRWAATHPWYPRVLPYLVYVGFFLFYPIRDVDGLGWTYPLIYIVQCSVTAFLLWRYRKLLPELTLRFHWLAVPVGIGVVIAWIGLGWAVAGVPSEETAGEGWNFFEELGGPAWLPWFTLGIRLLGMSILVPIFEELFVRSLLLRSFADPKQTGIGVVQFLVDMPLIGDWLIETKLGERAHQHDPVFGREFERHALGELTVFGVAASTVVFMVGHGVRDWPATIVCGVAYCLLLAATRKRGLGPVIWAHGITNALLWGYTVYMHAADGQPADWRFF